jgi:hypothetical protein
MINDEGGVGKDFLVSTISKVIDPINWFFQKSPTPASITLTQRPGKNGVIKKPIKRETIVYIEDATPKFTDDNPHFKLLLDNDVKDYPVVDKMKTFLVNWKKPIVIVTCAESSPNEQILRRIPQLSLDSSKEQTKAIFKRKRLIESGGYVGITNEDKAKITRFITSLKPYIVKIPDSVSNKIEDEFLKPNYSKIFIRTLMSRIYDYVKFSAVIHQHNRKHVDNNKIEADLEDYNNVKYIVKILYRLYQDGGSNDDLSQFNKRQKNIISELKNHSDEQYTIDRIFHLDCSGDVSKPQIYRDMRKIVRGVPNIKLFETPLKNTPNYYYWDNGKKEEDDDDFAI